MAKIKIKSGSEYIDCTPSAAEIGAATQAEVNTKDVLPYSQHSTGVGNGWRLVAKFNYSASAGDDRKVFRFKVKQGHGNGASYVFWGDYIVGLGTSSQITCSAVLSKSDGTFGKCGYRLDSENKTLYFYIWTGQYSAYYTSDVTSLTAGTKGTVTWYTEAALTADTVTEGVNTYYPTTTGTLALTSDSRFTNARTPTAHASTATTYGVASTTDYGHTKYGNASGTACEGNDSRLSLSLKTRAFEDCVTSAIADTAFVVISQTHLDELLSIAPVEATWAYNNIKLLIIT